MWNWPRRPASKDIVATLGSGDRPRLVVIDSHPDHVERDHRIDAGHGQPGARFGAGSESVSPSSAARRSSWSPCHQGRTRSAGPRVVEHMVDRVMSFEAKARMRSVSCARPKIDSGDRRDRRFRNDGGRPQRNRQSLGAVPGGARRREPRRGGVPRGSRRPPGCSSNPGAGSRPTNLGHAAPRGGRLGFEPPLR